MEEFNSKQIKNQVSRIIQNPQTLIDTNDFRNSAQGVDDQKVVISQPANCIRNRSTSYFHIVHKSKRLQFII